MPLQLNGQFNGVTGGVDVGNAAANINEGKIGAINFGQADGLVINPGAHLDINAPANEMKIGAINVGNASVLGIVDIGANPSQMNFSKPGALTFDCPVKGLVINAIPGVTITFQHEEVELQEINNSNGEVLDLSLLNPPCKVEVFADHFEINPIEVAVAAAEEKEVEEVAVHEMNANIVDLALVDNSPADVLGEMDVVGAAEGFKDGQFEG